MGMDMFWLTVVPSAVVPQPAESNNTSDRPLLLVPELGDLPCKLEPNALIVVFSKGGKQWLDLNL